MSEGITTSFTLRLRNLLRVVQEEIIPSKITPLGFGITHFFHLSMEEKSQYIKVLPHRVLHYTVKSAIGNLTIDEESLKNPTLSSSLFMIVRSIFMLLFFSFGIAIIKTLIENRLVDLHSYRFYLIILILVIAGVFYNLIPAYQMWKYSISSISPNNKLTRWVLRVLYVSTYFLFFTYITFQYIDFSNLPGQLFAGPNLILTIFITFILTIPSLSYLYIVFLDVLIYAFLTILDFFYKLNSLILNATKTSELEKTQILNIAMTDKINQESRTNYIRFDISEQNVIREWAESRLYSSELRLQVLATFIATFAIIITLLITFRESRDFIKSLINWFLISGNLENPLEGIISVSSQTSLILLLKYFIAGVTPIFFRLLVGLVIVFVLSPIIVILREFSKLIYNIRTYDFIIEATILESNLSNGDQNKSIIHKLVRFIKSLFN